MEKDKLIKKILNAPNPEEEAEKYLKSNEIDFNDLLTEKEINNLIDFFDSDIYKNDNYFRFPVFYKINQTLKQNNIDLNKYDLEDLETRIEIFEKLFKLLKESQDYSVYTERALFEIIYSLGEMELSFEQSKGLENLFKDLIDFSYFLYDKTRDILCIENIMNILLSLSKTYLKPDEVKKLINYFDKFYTLLQPEALSDQNISFFYISSIVALIRHLIKTKHLKEVEKYLNLFINYSKQFYEENKFPGVSLSLNLNLLVSLFERLDLDSQVESMINQLIKMIESFLKEDKFKREDKETFLVDLSILYLTLNDVDNSISYLDEAAKLVKENIIKENPIISADLISHLFSLKNIIGEEKYSQFLYAFFQAQNNEELYYYFRENLDNENYDSYLKETNKETENLEAELEKTTEETPSFENFIELSDIKLSVAYDSVYTDNYNKAQNKIKEIEELLGKFSEYRNLQDYKRIQYEIDLFKEFFNYLNDESINISEFIKTSSKLINKNLFDFKNLNFSKSPIAGLLKVVGKLILLEDDSAALTAFKRIKELFKEFPSSQQDLESLQTYFILLNGLTNITNNQESLDWINKAKKEITNYIENLNIPESDYILNNPYLEEASKLEERNNYTKALFTYQRAIDYLLLYPNAEKNREITDEIGETYLDVGRILRELGETTNAIDNYKKGLDYLIRYGLNKTDYKHITDILVANSAIGGMYLENEEFGKSIKYLQRQDGIIKNTLSDIKDSFFLNFYLEELNNRFFLLHALKRYSEQEELFEEMLSLFDNHFIRNESFEDLILFINSFINWNKDASNTPGIWSWKKYIEEIFNILRKYKITIKFQNFEIEPKSAFLDLSLSYIEYCLELGKPIPDDFLTQTIKLAREISKYNPEEEQDILRTAKDLELIREEQRSMITRSFTKKKKVYKKRGKKTAGRNKRKKKRK